MLYSATHNLCVYDVPQSVAAYVPEAIVLAPERIAVPCTMLNMQRMRSMGYEALSPILTQYDWPCRPGITPFAKQRLTSAFMTLHPRCFNLNDIGTGKTLSVLWALDFLMQQGLVKKALIISPLSTLETVWASEIYKNFLSRRKAIILYGDRKKRRELAAQPADFYIINHDGLGIGTRHGDERNSVVLGDLAAALRADPDVNAVVIDEGTVYKDSGALRRKVMHLVIKDKPYVWWLTGTPTPNEPVDAWAQARAVRPDYLESQKNFRDRTMYQLGKFKWLPRAGAANIVTELLQPAIRFKREDFIDLPPLMTADRQVELSAGQLKTYKELKKNLQMSMANGGQITAVNEATLRMKLIQICCGAVYDAAHKTHVLDCAPRLAVLNEVIESVNEKILIFAPLTSVVNLLKDHLSKDYTVELINGEVSAKDRAKIFQDFQNAERPRIIVADPRTMAHGLTLTAASCIIWYGPTDQPEIYTQANGRVNRPGQTKSMLVVRLMSTAIEREIYRRLDNKSSLQGLMLDLIRGEQ